MFDSLIVISGLGRIKMRLDFDYGSTTRKSVCQEITRTSRAYISLCRKPAKLPQLSRSIVQAKINALVTPLEKPSPRGDTGNEPVFRLRFPKEVKTRFFRKRNHNHGRL
jgi:hypothetical protein